MRFTAVAPFFTRRMPGKMAWHHQHSTVTEWKAYLIHRPPIRRGPRRYPKITPCAFLPAVVVAPIGIPIGRYTE